MNTCNTVITYSNISMIAAFIFGVYIEIDFDNILFNVCIFTSWTKKIK